MSGDRGAGGLRIRPMTGAEFARFRAELVVSYAASHVEAGDWTPSEAAALASRETDLLLPEGEQTPGMLLLVAETADGVRAGHAWLALSRGDIGGAAFIYDIEVAPDQRGRGYGRSLLTALEQAAARAGAPAISLNVFGPNAVARRLYETAGYEVTSLQMRKALDG